MQLPKTNIETDSYVAVQILEKQNRLDEVGIKYMAEKVSGSFSFTILTDDNTLWMVKGDSPLSIVHFPEKQIYVYASTDEILYKGLIGTDFFKDVKEGNFEELDIQAGQILKITPDGSLSFTKFNYVDDSYFGNSWWYYGRSHYTDNSYLDDLKIVAKNQGYTDDTIDDLIGAGFTMEEIEDFIYSY